MTNNKSRLTVEKMNININIAGQEEGKFRTFYLVVGILGLIYIALTFMTPDLGLTYNYFMWIVLFPVFIEAILYGLGKKRIFADNSPYLRIDDERIEKSKGGIFANPDIDYWKDVKNIDIKLFEIQLTTFDGRNKSVDLANLSDDNLKIVKDYLLTVKRSKGL